MLSAEKFNKKNDLLIFLHIPKAAGSTVHYVLESKYSKSNTFSIRGSREYLEKDIHQIKTLSSKERKRIRLLKGHMPFGLHKYFDQKAQYFTLLRDPVCRIISEYYYIRRNPSHYLFDILDGKNMDIYDFVASGITTEINDGQVRLLSGDFAGVDQNIPYGQTTNKMLIQAQENIKNHFLLVGLVEKFDESLLLLKRKLHWHVPPFYFRRNVSKVETDRKSVSVRTLELIQGYNSLDMKLYKWIKKRLEKNVNEIKNFKDKLNSFQALNGIYQKVNLFKLLHKINKRV